ncbi:MFS-type transporter pynF-like protein [Cladobotryum mycophilum]|uniref:MFS-type transporter pynF-like protein n=1 Tax=Cladobotryum mycophilum TaxID=491253 RepID=A0ABR0SH11_9HYPO
MPSCSLCNGFQKKDDSDVRLALELKPEELLDSVEVGGCWRCSLILDAITRFGYNKLWPQDQAGDSGRVVVQNVAMIYVYGLSGGGGGGGDTLSIEIYLKNDEPKRILELFYPQMALEHESCPSEKHDSLPHRVLALETLPSGNISVRLLENGGAKGRYATLSHCWGSYQTCVTTRAALDQHKKDIPWLQIPPTFQDSIRFCLAIGIHHLWIDALCIIQDDLTDWQLESAQMADIYQNSYIMLAATSSTSDSGGCFPTQVSEYSAANEETLAPGTTTDPPVIKFREKLQHWMAPLTQVSARLHPLLSRGWCFQERILSPRVLHFCAHEMIWECNTETLCECGSLPVTERPRELFNEILESELFARSHGFHRHYVIVDQGDSNDENESNMIRGIPNINQNFQSMCNPKWDQEGGLPSYSEAMGLTSSEDYFHSQQYQSIASSRWQNIVGQYSSLLLSRDTDRLPALSGLASRVKPYLGEYLAGLWSSTLRFNILWRVDKLEPKVSRPTRCRGPSWSWASIDGTVSYWNDISFEPAHWNEIVFNRARLNNKIFKPTHWNWPQWMNYLNWDDRKPLWQSHAVKLTGRNPSGEVASGGISIIGCVLPVKLQYVWTRPWLVHDSRAREHEPLKYKIGFHLELPFFADYVLSEEVPYRIEDKTDIYMLLVHPDICLVLVEVPDEVATYRRIGVIRQPQALSSNIAIVGTCALGVMYFGLPVVIGVQRLSPTFSKWSPIIGVIVSSLSVIASSFSQSVAHLIITQGVFYAIGATILYCPCIIYLSDWFQKRKGFAYGVMLSGTGLGGCVLPPVLEVLLGHYGFRTTLRIWAISLVVLTLPLAYFIKPRVRSKPAHKDSPSPFNLRFALKRTFVLYQVSNICEALGFFLPSIYLPTYARSLGASESVSALTLLFVNFASVFGSAGMGVMTDNFHVSTCFLASAVGTVIGTFFFWGFATNLPMLFAFCNIYGLFAGSYTTAWQGVVRQITSDAAKEGKESFDQNMIIGIMAVGRGIGSVASGPLSNLLLQGMPLEGRLLSGYGTGYGPLILFTGVSAVMSGATYLWRRLGWM